MANEEFYNEEEPNLDEKFIITLSIDGSGLEEAEVEIENPYGTISDQIKSIVEEFDLPKIDGGGTPVEYRIGLADTDEFLCPVGEDGREMTFEDYNIQSGDHLHLVSIPIAG